MFRVGIVGTENSHTDHFVRHLNVEQRHAQFRVTVLAGGDTEKNRKLAAEGGITDIVEKAEDLVDGVDVALISDRHGGLHRPNAVPLLDAGKHVFVDKPLAVTTADAEAIVDAARRGGGVLASWSAVRLAPAVDELRAAAPGLGDVQMVSVTGPADPADPHAGLFFYGPHVVEPALEILGNPAAGPVQVESSEHTVVVTTQAGGAHVVLTFVRPGEHGRPPWHATVVGRHGVIAREVELGPDYNARGLARFLDAVVAGRPPMAYEQLITPVRVLEAATTRLAAKEAGHGR